jgi:hypothetical protein
VHSAVAKGKEVMGNCDQRNPVAIGGSCEGRVQVRREGLERVKKQREHLTVGVNPQEHYATTYANVRMRAKWPS